MDVAEDLKSLTPEKELVLVLILEGFFTVQNSQRRSEVFAFTSSAGPKEIWQASKQQSEEQSGRAIEAVASNSTVAVAGAHEGRSKRLAILVKKE